MKRAELEDFLKITSCFTWRSDQLLFISAHKGVRVLKAFVFHGLVFFDLCSHVQNSKCQFYSFAQVLNKHFL